MGTYVIAPAEKAKHGLRRALREIVVCAVLMGIALMIADGEHRVLDAATIAALFVLSFLWGTPLWAVYRLARFVIGR
jgi:hypothetical protein